jgi:glyoxylase-like metal-dependent hydrolase (beta-lactamase superfamily II)
MSNFFGTMPDTPHFTLHTITRGIYAAIAADGGGAFANSGIIDLGDKTIIFDTCVSPQASRDLIKAAQVLTERNHIDYVVNSHFHHDHMRGNVSFPETTRIISSTDTRELMGTRGIQQLKLDAEQLKPSVQNLEKFLATEGHRLPDHDRLDIVFIIGWQRAILDTLTKLKLRLPDITFDGQLTIRGSRRQAEILSFPNGHTDSDVVLLLPDDKMLFSGDLVFVKRHPFLGDAYPDGWINILDAMVDMPIEKIVPGHGPIGGPDDIQLTRDYISQINQMVADTVVRNGSLDEVLALPAPAPYDSWRNRLAVYETNLSVLYNRYARDVLSF